MSTLLQLVNSVREECDVSGSGDLATLSGVTGESLRIKIWVIRSYEEIQEMHTDWKWLRTSFSFTTTADDGSYTSAQAGITSRFGMWDKSFCTVYLTASGVADQSALTWMEYEDFRACYLRGTQTSDRPTSFTIGNSNELLVGPTPDSTLYTIAGQYFKSPQILSADADEPEMPEQHKVIMYRAMTKYARFNAAPEIYTDANSNERRIINMLAGKYLPSVTLAGPLA